MLHNKIHGILRTELSFRKAFQNVFIYFDSSNENAEFH